MVVGLGNPGEEFKGTRHNLGAEAVELFGSQHSARLRRDRRLQALVGEFRYGEQRVAVAVPTMYMNESGSAVRGLVRRFGIDDLSRLVVAHDELDLPPGRVKVKLGGGTAGHNGLQSVQAHLRDRGFVRVRIGIGKPPGRMAGADYVLRRPPRAERQQLDGALRRATEAIEAILEHGVDPAMNRFNADPA